MRKTIQTIAMHNHTLPSTEFANNGMRVAAPSTANQREKGKKLSRFYGLGNLQRTMHDQRRKLVSISNP